MGSAAAIRVLVVYKRTTYERMHAQDAERAERLVQESGDFAAFIVQEHQDHQRTLQAVRKSVEALGAHSRFQTRDDLHDEIGDWDLVVTIGGDGTLLWASHLVSSHVPVLAVNSSPKTSVGYFAGATADTFSNVLGGFVAGREKRSILQRMRVLLNGKIASTRVLNDLLFSHIHPSLSTRYRITVADKSEDQLSSGIWIGPAAGSTAALESAGGARLPIDSRAIQYVVREPYSVRGQEYQLVRGLVEPGANIRVRCKIDRAILFIDGTQQVIDVAFGDEVQMDLSEEPMTLVGSFGSR